MDSKEEKKDGKKRQPKGKKGMHERPRAKGRWILRGVGSAFREKNGSAVGSALRD